MILRVFGLVLACFCQFLCCCGDGSGCLWVSVCALVWFPMLLCGFVSFLKNNELTNEFPLLTLRKVAFFVSH